jgi:hypothetical protein
MRAALTFITLLLSACSAADQGTIGLDAPARAGFELESHVLHRRCGSLDCHGQPQRNLRLYGQYGLRLSTLDVPGGDPTTTAEHDENYRSLLALEPELLSDVVRDGGRDADRLTLVRKGRGSEEHKGGSAAPEGSASDRCLLSWLAGVLDTVSCEQGAALNRP